MLLHALQLLPLNSRYSTEVGRWKKGSGRPISRFIFIGSAHSCIFSSHFCQWLHYKYQIQDIDMWMLSNLNCYVAQKHNVNPIVNCCFSTKKICFKFFEVTVYCVNRSHTLTSIPSHNKVHVRAEIELQFSMAHEILQINPVNDTMVSIVL